MTTPFRVIDTGVRAGPRHMAFDQAMIELHKTGVLPDTVRFMRFPPTVLIGRHQALGQEVNLARCASDGVALTRRMTGGGAIYLDENQVGWELVLSRARLPLPTLADYTSAICEAVARGLSTAFGIDARHRQRSDIAVQGRKLCGTGGFFDGSTLIYQGTVLVDVDPARLVRYLNVPRGASDGNGEGRPEARLITLRELLGGVPPAIDAVHTAVLDGLRERLGIDAAPAAPTAEEEALADRLLAEEFGTEAFLRQIDEPVAPGVLTAVRQTPGGTVSAYVRLEGQGRARRIREVLLAGDLFVQPPDLLFDLEASLRGVEVEAIAATVRQFFAARQPAALTVPPESIGEVILAATRSED